MRKIKTIIILMMLSVMSCFAACSSETKDPADIKPEIARFEPLTAITEGGRNIYLIVKLVDSSYWQVIINGARDAGEAYGVNIYCGGTNIETDWQGQRQLIDEALQAVAACYPRDAGDLSALKKCADTALYKAKEKGRNRYIWFTA